MVIRTKDLKKIFQCTQHLTLQQMLLQRTLPLTVQEIISRDCRDAREIIQEILTEMSRPEMLLRDDLYEISGSGEGKELRSL